MPRFGGRPTDADALSGRDIVALGNYVFRYRSADTAVTEQQVAETRRGVPPLRCSRSPAGAGKPRRSFFWALPFLVVRRRKVSA